MVVANQRQRSLCLPSSPPLSGGSEAQPGRKTVCVIARESLLLHETKRVGSLTHISFIDFQ